MMQLDPSTCWKAPAGTAVVMLALGPRWGQRGRGAGGDAGGAGGWQGPGQGLGTVTQRDGHPGLAKA